MSYVARIAIFAAVASFASLGLAFEDETHVQITARAVQASVLSQQSTLNDMGLQFSVTDNRQLFPNGRGRDRTILELFEDGARFEDTFPRPLNHFFNPLTGAGITDFEPSPNWAIDGEGDTSTTKFSYRAARGYMVNALTGFTDSSRRTQFGRMFRSLGQVGHHIQDMAQPQHTRADLHCKLLPCGVIGKYAPSAYEKHTDKEAASNRLPFTLPPPTGGSYEPTYGQADVQTFNNVRKFWQTTDGKGMADYSNRGFVSAGTNFDRPGLLALFPSPAPAAASSPLDIGTVCAEEATKGRPCPNSILALAGNSITFYGTNVEDKLRPSMSTFNPRTSSHSAFDPDLTRAGRPPAFSLNRFTFNTANDLLIPRAVGYTAGLINYFFRGKLALERQGPGMPLLVKNLSTEQMKGDFTIHYDDAQGNRASVPIDTCRVGNVDVPAVQGIRCQGATLPSVNVEPNARLEVSFRFPTNPVPKTVGEYIVVFAGEMGTELRVEDEDRFTPGAVAAKQALVPVGWEFGVSTISPNSGLVVNATRTYASHADAVAALTSGVMLTELSGTYPSTGINVNVICTYNSYVAFYDGEVDMRILIRVVPSGLLFNGGPSCTDPLPLVSAALPF